MNFVFPVDEITRVSEVRRAAEKMARHQGMSDTACGKVALVATELATNLVKHARQGEIFLSGFSGIGQSGVQLVALDRGPGMRDVAACIKDGFSTAQTSGTGLGAVARHSQAFDIYSEPGWGTVLSVRLSEMTEQRRFDVGGVVKPMQGEEVSGDAWAFSERGSKLQVLVADGLGHGVMAARASSEAVAAFGTAAGQTPRLVLDAVHRALRSTRGAAVAVMQIEAQDGSIQFAGIGNIGAVVLGSPKTQTMISHAGTAGYGSPRLQEFSYRMPVDGIAVMYSDGLASNLNLEGTPRLLQHRSSTMAAAIYRQASRNRDDTCVVVIKPEVAPGAAA